jgi:hypothetical protein
MVMRRGLRGELAGGCKGWHVGPPSAQIDGINDISRILDNDRGHTYFIDAWHITEAGNDIVARRMAANAEPLLAQARQSRRQTPAPSAR